MKKNVLVIAGLAVLSTSAFASKARMEALGQSNSGSRYISDSRSVFLNPAELNGMKNYIVTEWGASAATDSATAPRAEGGFFRDAGAFAYGLYLGNDSSRIDHTSTYLTQTNAMDLFLAGDMGVKWGARVHYANAKDETTTTTKKHSALGLGLGMTQGDLSAHLNMDLADKSTGTGVVNEGAYTEKLKPSFDLGASYAWSGYTFFAGYTSNKAEKVEGTVTTTTKHSETSVGAGRVHEINPTARLFTDLTLRLTTDETSAVPADPALGKSTKSILPLTLGMEADATSWLVVRGSVSQNVFLGTEKNIAGKKKTTANSTNVNAGGTLNFGKLKVDGTIGTTPNARNGGTVGAKEGVLATDNLMSRVGVSYSF